MGRKIGRWEAGNARGREWGECGGLDDCLNRGLRGLRRLGGLRLAGRIFRRGRGNLAPTILVGGSHPTGDGLGGLYRGGADGGVRMILVLTGLRGRDIMGIG